MCGHIFSTKRANAARFGYDSAKAWQNLLQSNRNNITAAMNIPPLVHRFSRWGEASPCPHDGMLNGVRWSKRGCQNQRRRVCCRPLFCHSEPGRTMTLLRTQVLSGAFNIQWKPTWAAPSWANCILKRRLLQSFCGRFRTVSIYCQMALDSSRIMRCLTQCM